MSVSIIQNPTIIAPSSNYMWSVASPTSYYSGLTGYYQQFWVNNYTTNANFIKNNVKVYPNVYGGNGIYDVHRVLQNYVTYEPKGLQGTLDWYVSPQRALHYSIHNLEFSGSTLLSSYLNMFVGYVFYGGIEREQTFNFNQYIMTASTSSFLSTWNGPRYVRMTDRGSVSWLQGLINSFPRIVAVDVTCDDGSVKQYSKTRASVSPIGVWNFGSCPYEIENNTFVTGHTYNNIGPFVSNILSTNKAKSYTIRLLDSSSNPRSEVITYVIDYDCPLIENIQLMWIGKLGSWEGYTFYRERHKSLDIKKTNFRTNDYQFSNGQMNNPTYNRGETVLNIDVTERYSVVSKIVDNTMSSNIAQLFESPEVYMILNGVSMPVIVDLESVEIKNNYNRPDRAIYSFSFYKANKNITLGNGGTH